MVKNRLSRLEMGSLLLASALICGIAVQVIFSTPPFAVPHLALSVDNHHKQPAVPSVRIDPVYAADFADDRVLMGASHNVFVGRVIRQSGTKESIEGIPGMQFEVRVVYNIKGNLQNTVVVNQVGGYENGAYYYVEDGAPSLLVGGVYVLVTRYNSKEAWYTLNSFPSASSLIVLDGKASDVQLQPIVSDYLRVRQLKAAYPNEVLLDADVKQGNSRNSYRSLHADASMSTSSVSQ